MRMRCFLWPCSLPNNLICRCKSVVTLSHILNCKYFITYRSIVHDSVRDQLYAMNPELIRAHLFSSSQFGGVGFTKSSILCQAAFIGGGKNCIIEFLNCFPEDIHLLSQSLSKYLYDLDVAINKIAPEIWFQCFPDSVQEIPPRNLVNLRYCVKKHLLSDP
ncbi:hypothetical protein P9112_014646 [Eukaryota sp. TZLM1-RC]